MVVKNDVKISTGALTQVSDIMSTSVNVPVIACTGRMTMTHRVGLEHIEKPEKV